MSKRAARARCRSRFIKTHGGGEDLRVTRIEFSYGAIYRYFTVPPAVFRALMAADSKGEYFTHHIRTRFRYQQLA